MFYNETFPTRQCGKRGRESKVKVCQSSGKQGEGNDANGRFDSHYSNELGNIGMQNKEL